MRPVFSGVRAHARHTAGGDPGLLDSKTKVFSQYKPTEIFLIKGLQVVGYVIIMAFIRNKRLCGVGQKLVKELAILGPLAAKKLTILMVILISLMVILISMILKMAGCSSIVPVFSLQTRPLLKLARFGGFRTCIFACTVIQD
jgi:hypothetical protein